MSVRELVWGMGIRRNECERVGMGEWGYDGMSERELVWEWGNGDMME